MGVKYGRFELPEKIRIEEDTNEDVFLKFIAEPFERGFGYTVGNALRRIMLSSLEAPAIISVMLEGVPHEYTAIDGVIEDMTHIILNIKSGLIRKLPLEEKGDTRDQRVIYNNLEVTHEMLEKGGGSYVVKFGDLIKTDDFEVLNKDLPIFTATKPLSKKVAFRVAFGRGYMPSERHFVEERLVDEILIDSAFSPVRLVNYYVEKTRVGQDTDYDRLVLEVTTDGRVTPKEALTFSTQIAFSHFQVFDELKFQSIIFDKEEEKEVSERDVMLNKLSLKINEIELSVRSTNCLVQANIDTIAELVVMMESEMLRFRNFGKKSLNEIKAKLDELGLHLGMDLSKYGINKENVRQCIKDFINEKIKENNQ